MRPGLHACKLDFASAICVTSNKVTEQIKEKVKKKGKTRTVTKTITKIVVADFTWKDPRAAEKASMALKDYVIGGMDRSFKSKLYQHFARWTPPASCRG